MNMLQKVGLSEIENLRDKQVLIYGVRRCTQNAILSLIYFGVNVIGVVDFRGIPYFALGKYEKLPMITPYKLERLAKLNTDLVVIYSDKSSDNDIDKLDKMGLQLLHFTLEMLAHSLQALMILDELKNNPVAIINNPQYSVSIDTTIENVILREQRERNFKNSIIICNPAKTGDHTLNTTFDSINGYKKYGVFSIIKRIGIYFADKPNRYFFVRPVNKILLLLLRYSPKIDYVNIFHKPSTFNKLQYLSNKTIKIITAVREPISQNLSDIYQGIGAADGYLYNSWVIDKFLQNEDISSLKAIMEFEDIFVKNSGNIQVLFNEMVSKQIYAPLNSCNYRFIQQFITSFNDHVLNLFAYPFDQEAGYTIIKEGNVEVFVYQLEKLNSIVPQLSEWAGVPFDHLEKGNVGEDKWIGESYKQAQKEIEITQEYFERCYNEPYVKHFYSPADIEKFKARWRPHIKHED